MKYDSEFTEEKTKDAEDKDGREQLCILKEHYFTLNEYFHQQLFCLCSVKYSQEAHQKKPPRPLTNP